MHVLKPRRRVDNERAQDGRTGVHGRRASGIGAVVGDHEARPITPRSLIEFALRGEQARWQRNDGDNESFQRSHPSSMKLP